MDRHIIYILSHKFVQNLPFVFSMDLPVLALSSGTALFKHYLTCLLHQLTSNFTISVCTSMLSPLLPPKLTPLETAKNCPSTTVYLKSKFPRDFGQLLHKRSHIKNVVTINASQLCQPIFVNKRESKMIRKLNHITNSRLEAISK